MLNSHSSSLSLAGGRRACPALKPDAADQVLLKNQAGFAAFSKGRTFPSCREQDRCAGDREAGTGGASPAHNGQKRAAGAIRWIGRTGRASLQRGCIRVLSSRSAAGYVRRGISLLMLLHCRFSCVRVVFSMFSLLHFGFGPRCSSRYARRRTGGRTGRVSIRIFGCACRDVRGLASVVASAVDVPDSSRL